MKIPSRVTFQLTLGPVICIEVASIHMKERSTWSWNFTAPWEPISVRRGDALGFRAAADHFAELLAPGLNNGSSDARWISILSWCLKWSHVAWQNAGGSDLSRRDEQQARYAWLRPLELLWVARALESGQASGQLRGRRSVERWLTKGQRPANFAMTDEQYRRYRQIGTYGAYRVMLRTIPGLTEGDGWTPASVAHRLADLVNERLPRDARLNDAIFGDGTKWGHWNGKEARYWVERGWSGWRDGADRARGMLPVPDEDTRKPLPLEERRLLEPVLFGEQSILRIAALELARAKSVSSHGDLCAVLATSRELSKTVGDASLALLPEFSHFADATMHAMRGLWGELNRHGEKQAPPIADLARLSDLRHRFDQLRAAGDRWLRVPGRDRLAHGYVVTRLAEAMRDAATPIRQITALVHHHHEFGGGRRWFREQDRKLVPLVAHTGVVASNYRFRLRSLSLLAAQCGVAAMDRAIDAMAQHDFNDEEEAQ